MKILNAHRAVIEPVKLHGYLLSGSHSVGRLKARFFVALGYSSAQWPRLEADLRTQHLSQDATPVERTPHGQKYEIRATLVGPSGRSAGVVSCWIVRPREDFPRFVTAYPEGSR